MITKRHLQKIHDHARAEVASGRNWIVGTGYVSQGFTAARCGHFGDQCDWAAAQGAAEGFKDLRRLWAVLDRISKEPTP